MRTGPYRPASRVSARLCQPLRRRHHLDLAGRYTHAHLVHRLAARSIPTAGVVRGARHDGEHALATITSCAGAGFGVHNHAIGVLDARLERIGCARGTAALRPTRIADTAPSPRATRCRRLAPETTLRVTASKTYSSISAVPPGRSAAHPPQCHALPMPSCLGDHSHSPRSLATAMTSRESLPRHALDGSRSARRSRAADPA